MATELFYSAARVVTPARGPCDADDNESCISTETTATIGLSAGLDSRWRELFAWLPQSVSKDKSGRWYVEIPCRFCDSRIRVPRDRYPSLAGSAIYKHVRKKCPFEPDVELQPPRHQRKRWEELRPSRNRCRNQLTLRFDRDGVLGTERHPLGSLIRGPR
jgi:hypothetical protein